jgi:hypothetical protein
MFVSRAAVVAVEETSIRAGAPQQTDHMLNAFFTTAPARDFGSADLLLNLTVDGCELHLILHAAARFYFMLSVNAEGPQ